MPQPAKPSRPAEPTVTIHLSTDDGPVRLVCSIGQARKLLRELALVEEAYIREQGVVPLAGGNAVIDARPLGMFTLKG